MAKDKAKRNARMELSVGLKTDVNLVDGGEGGLAGDGDEDSSDIHAVVKKTRRSCGWIYDGAESLVTKLLKSHEARQQQRDETKKTDQQLKERSRCLKEDCCWKRRMQRRIC